MQLSLVLVLVGSSVKICLCWQHFLSFPDVRYSDTLLNQK